MIQAIGCSRKVSGCLAARSSEPDGVPIRVRSLIWGTFLVKIRLISIRMDAGGSVVRKWFLPLTVLGLSGVGVFLASEAGRNLVLRAIKGVSEAPESFELWNETAQRELDQIQVRLDQLAETFGIGPAQAI